MLLVCRCTLQTLLHLAGLPWPLPLSGEDWGWTIRDNTRTKRYVDLHTILCSWKISRGCHFAGLIFVDTHSHAHFTVYNCTYFVGLNFAVSRDIHENCENWTPQKFPAIWSRYYTCTWCLFSAL